MLQGPAAQQLHEEEVKTLVSEAVQAKEAEHESQLTQLRQLHEQDLEECGADVQERNRSGLQADALPACMQSHF